MTPRSSLPWRGLAFLSGAQQTSGIKLHTLAQSRLHSVADAMATHRVGMENSKGKMRKAARTLIAAFDRVNLVALGERHWAREDSQFRLGLIQQSAFAQKAGEIVIEFGNPLYQAVLDSFVSGDNVRSVDL